MDADTSELERLLCNPSPIGSIEHLVPRVPDAWSLTFPDLRSLGPVQPDGRKLRFCIATEDIVGPVRNGGIGTTYAALAQLIVDQGHHCTILFLKGREVETGDIDHWIKVYADKGVTFVPVQNYAVMDDFRTNADRWLRAPYNMLRYLLDHPMDVVHVSEWRGSAYLSLLAKRQGLAFAETLFIVKTSSPWMWNRLYGSQPLERLDDLAKVHAERQSVELADIVIGGSLHLLRWMASQGYRIPRERTFVQPNVVGFDTLHELMAKRAATPGTRTPVDEIVFFGRLEARKGLFVFCQAIKRLIRLGVTLPPQISFMGKPGARLTARPDQTVLEYIESESRDWPTKVEVLTEFQQYEAIDYLLSGRRLAVMPSMIENSSLAVYEAAICGIPCVASNAGGNAELVMEADREHVLCDPHPRPLADKIAQALEQGGYIPRPSFDNDANLDTWRWFHDALGNGLHQRLVEASRVAAPTLPSAETSAVPLTTAVCIYYCGQDDGLTSTLASLKLQDIAPTHVLISVDADDGDATARAHTIAEAAGVDAAILDAYDLDAGAAFNAAAERASVDYCLFLWAGCTLRPEALRALSRVAASSGADLLNYFHQVLPLVPEPGVKPSLKALLIGSPTDGYFRTDMTFLPLFVRRQTLLDLGGFTTDYRVLGQDYEFLAKAQLAGAHCETALLDLGAVPAWDPAWLSRRGYDGPISSFRVIRPHLAATPLGLRDLLLTSKGLQVRTGAGPKRAVPAVDPIEGRLTRMMQVLFADPPKRDPAPKPTVRAAPVVESRSAADRKANGFAMLQLIDDPGTAKTAKRKGVPTRQPRFSPRPDVARRGTVSGQFLASYNGSLYGWVADAADLSRSLEVELAIGDRRMRLPANMTLASVQDQPNESRAHGFVVPIPAARWRGLGRQAPRRATLTEVASGLVLCSDLLLTESTTRLADLGIEGWCDPSDVGELNGWAWRPSTPAEHLDIAIFIDGRVFTRVTASGPRDDLRHQGVGDGGYAFSVPTPKSVGEEGVHRIDVVLAESGVPLLRSPMTLTQRLVSVSAPPSRRRR